MINNPEIGKIYKLYAYREEDHKTSIVYGKIIDIRDIFKNKIGRKNYLKNKILRSQFLITFKNCETEEYRSYYSQFLHGRKAGFLSKNIDRLKKWLKFW